MAAHYLISIVEFVPTVSYHFLPADPWTGHTLAIAWPFQKKWLVWLDIATLGKSSSKFDVLVLIAISSLQLPYREGDSTLITLS